MTKYNDNGNLAHELEMPYEETRQEHEQAENESAAERNRKNAANPMSLRAKAAWGILLTVTIVMLGSLIYGKVEVSRLYSERAGLERELSVLQNENVSMQSEIAERMNMTKVEEYARNDLGLQKLDKSQIEYIEIETPSVSEVKDDREEDVFVRIKQWFNNAAEYLGL